MTKPRAGRFWAVWPHDYDLIQWGLDGTQLRRLERHTPWFDETASGAVHDWRNQAPRAYVAGIDEDTNGHVWVFVATAAPTWRDVVDAVPAGVGEYDPRRMDLTRLMMLTIEVIDPVAGQVLARQALRGYPLGTVPGVGFALQSIDEASGRDRVHVLRATLAGSAR